jgi:hypothetical protein
MLKHGYVSGCLLVLAVAACGSAPAPSGQSSPASSPSPSQTPRTLTFQLTGLNGNPAHGTVVVDVKAGTGFTVTVTVFGLQPNSGHTINVHAGQCPNIDTSVDMNFDHGTADASGKLVDVTNWPGLWVDMAPAGGRTLTIHGSDPPIGSQDDPFAHIGCASLSSS